MAAKDGTTNAVWSAPRQKVLVWEEPSRKQDDSTVCIKSPRKSPTRSHEPNESVDRITKRFRQAESRAEQARVRRNRDRYSRALEAFVWPGHRSLSSRERKFREILCDQPILQVRNLFKGDIGAQLRLDDLCRLERNGWLTGDVINWVIFSMIASFVENVRRSPDLVYSSDFVDFLRRPPCQTQQKAVRYWHWSSKSLEKGSGRRFNSYKRILVPFNVGTKHWCLAVLEPGHCRVNVYNSASGCLKEETREIAECLARYATDRSGSDKPWAVVQTSGLHQQENGYDCGVFVCAYVEALLTSKDPAVVVDQNSVTELRARLLIYALELAAKH